MAITGYLSEFSLPELFQFLEQGQKTGRLSLNGISQAKEGASTFHIWFRQGRIIAAANRLDGRGLLTSIVQRGWLDARGLPLLNDERVKENPLGLYLKSRGLLQAEQLKLLFYVQVMQQICALFQLNDAQFVFDPRAPLPVTEMTGLSSPGAEVTLAGLRALKDWSMLQDKLPDPSSAMTAIANEKPKLNLNQSEWQVWEHTDGKTSLRAVAEQLRLPIAKIQQTAFRLIVVNLAEELPLVAMTSEPTNVDMMANTMGGSNNGLSQDFLQNLMGFLQKKSEVR